ncbi:MAG: hypothetical protein JWO32_2823 [Bacteroidetes bacterium]|nr:hypothetical protein [Bacteroidota bacterium]
MRKLIYLFIFYAFTNLQAQILHPTAPINGEYVGACLTSTCSAVYTDNGGAGGNYSNNIGDGGGGGIYRVFCPNTATNCVQMTFTAFNVNKVNANCFTVGGGGAVFGDFLSVGNGPTQNSTAFTTAPANASGFICGTPGVPFSYTSTDASGCLITRFYSDGATNAAGWSANITCVPCAGGPSGKSNSDCQFATAVCSNLAIASNATGPGIVSDGCTAGSCPAGGENFSNWYQVLFNTSGTFGFTISPTNPAADYDFAVYGPGTNCGALGATVRCNDSSTSGNTGLSATGTGATQTTSGTTFCTLLNVTAGQTYFVVVDSWSPPSGGYNLTWGGTATFNCAILPVDMVSFDATYNMKDKQTELIWKTANERNVNYYAIERSSDGSNFTEILEVQPVTGNSSQVKNYYAADKNPMVNEINYYKIVAVDYDGRRTPSNLQAVAFQDDDANLKLVPNPAKDMVELSFKSNFNKAWDISFYDSKGKINKRINYTAQTLGTNKYIMDLSGFNKGMYFVIINDGFHQYKRKLIIE